MQHGFVDKARWGGKQHLVGASQIRGKRREGRLETPHKAQAFRSLLQPSLRPVL